VQVRARNRAAAAGFFEGSTLVRSIPRSRSGRPGCRPAPIAYLPARPGCVLPQERSPLSESLPILLALTLMTAIAWLFVRRAARGPRTRAMRVDELPAVLEALERGAVEGSFAAVVVQPAAGGDALNVQYSIEAGRPGLDWLLAAGGGSGEGARFREIAAAHGSAVDAREMNAVRYLRAEGGGLDRLGMAVLQELGGLRPDDEVTMLMSGVEWPVTR
jgi:hypothetical protein